MVPSSLAQIDGDVRDGRIRNPHLGAVKDIVVAISDRSRDHARGIGAMIRLRQTEASHQFAGGEARQEPLPLRLRAVGVDRVHDEGRLHAHGGAIAAIDALYLAGHQAIRRVGHSGTAVLLRQGGAKETCRAHLVHDLAVEALVPIGFHHPRHQSIFCEIPRGIPYQPLFFGQLVVEQERVVPSEGSTPSHRHSSVCVESPGPPAATPGWPLSPTAAASCDGSLIKPGVVSRKFVLLQHAPRYGCAGMRTMSYNRSALARAASGKSPAPPA